MEIQIIDNNLIKSDLIIKTVSKYYEIDPEELKTDDRHRPLVKARQQSIFFIMRETTLKLKEIGSLFNRDHSTVIHSKEAVDDLSFTDRHYRSELLNLKELIKAALL